MLGLPEAAAHAREAIAVAARVGDDWAQARGYLALQLALGLRSAYPQAVDAADEARRRLTALGADVALRCLDVQLAQTHQIGGNLAAAAAAGQRALAGLGPGERWLHGHVQIISALALYRLPGRQAECARAAGEALRAMRDLGNPIGEACALDVLGWLAADAGRCQRAAWLLGAAQTRWLRAGGRPSGNAVMAGHHQRSADAAGRALGLDWYAELHARGAGLPLDQVVKFAVAGDDVPPGGPRPGLASLSGRPLLGVPEPQAAVDEVARRRSAGPTPRSSPAANWRSPRWWRSACPTGTSPTGCSSPGGPWTRTSTTSSPSSGCPRGCSSPSGPEREPSGSRSSGPPSPSGLPPSAHA